MVNSWNPAIIGEELEKVKAVTSAGIEANAEAIEALGTYSTDEVETGMLYGNKPMYRKLFVVDPLPNNTTTSFNHGIDNLGDVIIINAVAQVGSKPGRNLTVLYNSVQISVQTSTDLSDASGIVFIEYTKTPPTP